MTQRKEGPWILVVDDDQDVREMLCLVLETRGFVTHEASDGNQALNALNEFGAPAVILLDLRMPNANGEDFVRQLELAADNKKIPFVLLSGDAKVKEKAREMGAALHLMKPVDSEVLVRTMQLFIKPSSESNVRA